MLFMTSVVATCLVGHLSRGTGRMQHTEGAKDIRGFVHFCICSVTLSKKCEQNNQ